MAIPANGVLRLETENRGFLAALADFFTLFGAAVEAANAVENGRRPAADVLARLGLSAESFPDRMA